MLTEHADRSTIAAEDLPLLDTFLEEQKQFQSVLRARISEDRALSAEHTSDSAIRDHFRLLQATDNLSLVGCVDFREAAHLLYRLALRNGRYRWRRGVLF